MVFLRKMVYTLYYISLYYVAFNSEDTFSTSPPVSPSPSKERGRDEKRGETPLRRPIN